MQAYLKMRACFDTIRTPQSLYAFGCIFSNAQAPAYISDQVVQGREYYQQLLGRLNELDTEQQKDVTTRLTTHYLKEPHPQWTPLLCALSIAYKTIHETQANEFLSSSLTTLHWNCYCIASFYLDALKGIKQDAFPLEIFLRKALHKSKSDVLNTFKRLRISNGCTFPERKPSAGFR